MPSAAQIRAARALLGISAKDLARLTGVGWATIQRYEAVVGIPGGHQSKIDRIVRALEAAGIEFIGDPIHSPGVRLNPVQEDTPQPAPDSKNRP
jgi:predicted transcriptional regulator